MFNSKPRYNYDKPANQNDEDLIEKLDPEKIDEFKNFIIEIEDKLKVIFGPSGTKERLRFDKIKEFVSDIGNCRALALLMYYDFKTKNLINFKKISAKEKNGEEALISLKMIFGDELKLPWMNRMNLFDYPFQIEYKKFENQKAVDMVMEFRKFNTLAKYRLIIRSI